MFDPDAEFAWMATIARETGRPVTFGCLQDDLRPDQWRRLIELADEATASGARIVPQVAGRPACLLLGWESTAHPFLFHQTWQDIAALPREERLARLRTAEVRDAMLAERTQLEGIAAFLTSSYHKLFPLGDPPEYEPGPEQSLQALAARQGTTPEAIAYDLLLQRGRPRPALPAAARLLDGDFGALREMLVHPGTVLGLGDGGAHCGLLCDAQPARRTCSPTGPATATAASGWAWRRRSTSRPGAPRTLYGFDDRGLLAPGYLADVNVIDFDALALDGARDGLRPAGRRAAHDPAGPRLRGHGQARRRRARGRRGHRRAPRPPPARPAAAGLTRRVCRLSPRISAVRADRQP